MNDDSHQTPANKKTEPEDETQDSSEEQIEPNSDRSIENLFHGKVLNIRNGNHVDLMYDFSTSDQLTDWSYDKYDEEKKSGFRHNKNTNTLKLRSKGTLATRSSFQGSCRMITTITFQEQLKMLIFQLMANRDMQSIAKFSGYSLILKSENDQEVSATVVATKGQESSFKFVPLGSTSGIKKKKGTPQELIFSFQKGRIMVALSGKTIIKAKSSDVKTGVVKVMSFNSSVDLRTIRIQGRLSES